MTTSPTTCITLARLACLLLAALTPALGSCKGQASEYCDDYCGCENCSDRDRERCMIDEQERIDVAADYDCSDPFDVVNDCILAKFDCKENHFEMPKGTECGKEYHDLNECLDRGSDCEGEGCPR